MSTEFNKLQPGFGAQRVSCTRRLSFCAGHRVYRHEGKCRNAHGHNYCIEVEASARLDALGRVIDFSVLKERIGGWIEAQWDHGFLLWAEDRELLDLLSQMPGQKLFLMPCNPTAENLAIYLLEVVCPKALSDTGVQVTRVVVHETENCKAEASCCLS